MPILSLGNAKIVSFGIGDIGISALKINDNAGLGFTTTKRTYEIGQLNAVKQSDIIQQNEVILMFTDKKSIDVLIDALNKIKEVE